MNNKIVIANWKMQLGLKESLDVFNEIKIGLPKKNNNQIVICPSFISMSEINNLNDSGVIKLGGQDVFWEETGAYTGEISCKMLREVGCDYVIIGHSDRRNYFKETNEMIHYKTRVSLGCKLIPIVCVGETYKERQEGRKEYVIVEQIVKALSGIDIRDGQIIVAYEPIWVIGSGQAIDPDEAEYMHTIIKKALVDIFTLSIVEKNFKIIYGASINKDSVNSFLERKVIDGVLVGGASLAAENFLGIIKKVNSIK
jgi:triosephosphate isomerase (TIM)